MWAKIVFTAAITGGICFAATLPCRFAHEMHTASLPGQAIELLRHSCFQTLVGIGDDQMHPRQAAGFEAGKELTPKLERLTVTDRGTQDFAGGC